MSLFWKGLVVLLLTLPVGAYVAGSLAGPRVELPDQRPPVLVDDPDPVASSGSGRPSESPRGGNRGGQDDDEDRDGRDDDRRDDDDDDDVRVVRPDPDDLDDDDSGDDNGDDNGGDDGDDDTDDD